MLDVHKSKTKESDKLTGLTYSKRWNVMDFLGKYHLSRFENKQLPLPGTQIKVERDHLKAKEDDLTRFQAELKKRSAARIHKNETMMKMVEFTAEIFFDTVIGSQIRASEDILNEREQLLNHAAKRYDSMAEVEEVFENVRLGRYHFIAHAIRNGYRSVDYQERESGDTCLHIAARNGFPKCVEELLLYRAEPNVKNTSGSYPIHCSWRFWKYHKYRTKEEREDQENRTCDILTHFLSFGAFVDAQDQDGNTPLHMACKHKNLRTVKLLLFFRADPMCTNKQGLTALDMAAKRSRNDILGMLTLFISLKKVLEQFDFSVLWQQFLQDSLATISDERDASKVLFELSMDEKVQSVARDASSKSGLVPIDDELLRRAFTDSLENRFDIKPWDADWKGFVADYLANKGNMPVDNSYTQDLIVAEMTRRTGTVRGASRGSVGEGYNRSNASTHSVAPSTPQSKPRKLPSLPTPEARPKSAYQADLFHSVDEGLLGFSPSRQGRRNSNSNSRSPTRQKSHSRPQTRDAPVNESRSVDETTRQTPSSTATETIDKAQFSIDMAPIYNGNIVGKSEGLTEHASIMNVSSVPQNIGSGTCREGVDDSLTRGRTLERRGSAGDVHEFNRSSQRSASAGEHSNSRQRRRSFDSSSRESSRGPSTARRGSADNIHVAAVAESIPINMDSTTGSNELKSMKYPSVKFDASPHKIARLHRKQQEKQSRKIAAESTRPGMSKQLSFMGPIDQPPIETVPIDTKENEDATSGEGGGATPLPPPLLSRMESRAGSRMESRAGTAVSTTSNSNSLEVSKQNWDAFFMENPDGSNIADNRPLSQLRQRNLKCAYAVGLDGKFAASTKRPAISSKLLVSHRKPEAALTGTEEEMSVVRAITTQGKDFDEYSTSIELMPRHLRLMHLEAPLEISILGEYQPRIVEYKSKERDELFSRLTSKSSPLSSAKPTHSNSNVNAKTSNDDASS